MSASKLESFNVHQDTSANAVMAETKICTMYVVCSKRSMTLQELNVLLNECSIWQH